MAYALASGIAVAASGVGGLSIVAEHASGVTRFYTGGTTERMRLDAAGLFGVGTSAPKSKLHIEGASGWIIGDEQDTNPTTTELDANDSVAYYTKANKLCFAYNNAGTITYLSVPLDGSSVTWTHSTTAP